MYGKQTETAIAAVGYLAELWRETGTRRVSAADVAEAGTPFAKVARG